MKELYEQPSYWLKDSRKLESLFKNKLIDSPDLVITSPPYFDLLNYENNNKQIGYGEKYDDYLSSLSDIFQVLYCNSNKNATFWLVIDTFKKKGEVQTLPFDIVNQLKIKFNNTWVLKDIIIWDKEKNIPWANGGSFKNQFEYILFFSKTKDFTFNIDDLRELDDLKAWWKTYPERYNPKGKPPSNIWKFRNPIRGWGNGSQKHLCPFPFSLVEKIIRLSSNKGDVIVDPFAGSGTVLAMAHIMDRKAFGLDINSKYKSLYTNEVLNGAKTYWNRKEEDFENNAKEFANFEKLIFNLRKLKVGNNVIDYLNNNQHTKYTSFVISEQKSDLVSIILITNKKPSFELDNEKINELIKKSKVRLKVEMATKEEILIKLNDTNLYRYSFKKFYSYINETKIDNILKAKTMDNYFYSNIKVRVK